MHDVHDTHDPCDHHARHRPGCFPHGMPEPDFMRAANSPIWQMHRISRLFMALSMRMNRDAETQPLPMVLFLLADETGRLQRDQKELAAAMRVTPATIAGTLKRLHRDGLIHKKEDPSDLRRNLIELTDKGFALVNQHRAQMDALQEKALAGIGDDERRALCETIRRIEANLHALHATPPSGP